jgi:hypothetical protein
MLFKQFKRAPRARGRNPFAFYTHVLGSVLLVTALLASPSYAARPKSKVPGATIIINGDPGGSVRKRYGEIQQINRLGQRVEIRRGACMSSCTMFLGVQNVCVTPQAVLGFHGPYRFGSKLTQVEFDRWSKVISAHYPPAIKTWYMTSARYNTRKPSKLSGVELIRLGVRKCA